MKVIRLVGADYTEYMKNFNGARHRTNKGLWDAFGIESGGVRITNPGGRFIGIVRQDPGPVPEQDDREAIDTDGVSEGVMAAQSDNIRRMKNSGHMNVTNVPKPRACKCKEWPWDERQFDDKRKPLAHHPKCAFKKMYERSKGTKITHVAAGPTLEATVHRAGKITNTAINRGRLQGTPAKADKLKEKIEKIPHPDRCPKCKDFTKSKKMDQDQHHPTCDYFKKYKALSHARAAVGKPILKPEPSKLEVMLMDLESGEIAREAEADEIEEGRRRLRDEGVALAHVDGVDYLCMYKDGTTLEPAEGEPQTVEHADTEPPAAGVDEDEDEDGEEEPEAAPAAVAG